MSLPPLTRRSLAGASTGLTAGRPSSPPAGILHLGLGNFHRAHQAVYTDAALTAEPGPWGVLGVASRSAEVVEALRAQDMLYTVVEISSEGSDFRVPDVHTDAFVAADEPDRLLHALAAPAIRIVTLTVTERGYTYAPSTGALDLDDDGVRSDLTGLAPARTVIGQLTRGLQQRARSSGAPVTVLSCDNLTENGRHTERLVREFAGALPAAEAEELITYLDSAVRFPSSMVDRIVPATTDAYRATVAEHLGFADAVPVPAERFSMWVLEDDFAAGRPAWEGGGATFSDEVTAYEQLKLRLLNGTHSLLAYLGALDGAATIAEAVETDFIERAARIELRREYLPSLTVPRDVDVAEYERQLFSRWRTRALGHRTSQVGSDGSAKLRQRIPGPALHLLATGMMPSHLALAVAAYLTCLAPLDGFDPGPHAREMRDPARGELAALARRSADGTDLARQAVGDRELLGRELSQEEAFIARTGELVDVLHRWGPRAAAEEAAGEGGVQPLPGSSPGEARR
jgi:fructuronate reductase